MLKYISVQYFPSQTNANNVRWSWNDYPLCTGWKTPVS